MVSRTDFLEGIEPSQETHAGARSLFTFDNEEDALKAMRRFRQRGFPVSHTGCFLLVGSSPKVNPFVDQLHFQHVFQQHLLPHPEKNYALYRELIKEELGELDRATTAEEHLDALIDLIYVTIGAGVALGHDMQGAWEEIHKTNMAKLDAEGNPIIREDGKVVKPEGWTPPNLKPFVGHVLEQFKRED